MSTSASWPAGVWAVLAASAFAQSPVGTSFTYQGRVKLDGNPVDQACDFQFSLWDAAGSGNPPTGGGQIGPTIPLSSVPVSEGLFTLQLDFGAGSFPGEARWLQMAVAIPSGGTLTTIGPRQRLTPTPFSLATRGVEVDASGNVGIGTNSPANKLSVVAGFPGDGFRLAGAVLNAPMYSLFNDNTYQGGLGLALTGGQIVDDAVAGDLVLLSNSGRILLQSGLGASDVTISGGNVGIGTATPAQKLDVAGTVQMTGFRMPTGGQAGDVLTNDGIGNGTWAPGSGGSGLWAPSGADIYNTNSRNVGIGTTSPVYKLHVDAGAPTDIAASFEGLVGIGGAPTGGRQLYVQIVDGAAIWGETNSIGGEAVNGVATNNNVAAGNSGGYFRSLGGAGVGVQGEASHTSGANIGVNGFSLSANGTGVFGDARASSGANIGVRGRTNSPTGYAGYFEGGKGVEVSESQDTTTRITVRNTSPTGNAAAAFEAAADVAKGYMYAYSSNLDSPTPDNRVAFGAQGGDGVDIVGPLNGNIRFWPNSYGGAAQEAVHITGGGEVGIGVVNPTVKLDVAGNIQCQSLIETSSARFKTHVRPLTDALAKVLALQGVRFRWVGGNGGEEDVGFIGEQVVEVLPEVVRCDENGNALGLNYGHLSAVTIEAMKEQQAQIDALEGLVAEKERVIAEQQQRMDDLASRLDELEALVRGLGDSAP